MAMTMLAVTVLLYVLLNVGVGVGVGVDDVDSYHGVDLVVDVNNYVDVGNEVTDYVTG